MTESEMEEVVSRGVKRAFRDLGIDVADWKEVRADMTWVRKNRMRWDSVSNRVISWFFIFIVGGGALAGWKDALANIIKGVGR